MLVLQSPGGTVYYNLEDLKMRRITGPSGGNRDPLVRRSTPLASRVPICIDLYPKESLAERVSPARERRGGACPAVSWIAHVFARSKPYVTCVQYECVFAQSAFPATSQSRNNRMLGRLEDVS